MEMERSQAHSHHLCDLNRGIQADLHDVSSVNKGKCQWLTGLLYSSQLGLFVYRTKSVPEMGLKGCFPSPPGPVYQSKASKAITKQKSRWQKPVGKRKHLCSRFYGGEIQAGDSSEILSDVFGRAVSQENRCQSLTPVWKARLLFLTPNQLVISGEEQEKANWNSVPNRCVDLLAISFLI